MSDPKPKNKLGQKSSCSQCHDTEVRLLNDLMTAKDETIEILHSQRDYLQQIVKQEQEIRHELIAFIATTATEKNLNQLLPPKPPTE